eukprot:CAMPEP_0171180972 /NCGR_PEP_ID=MMETSP0790-20130122/14026_1 /TAXON_ID=2925 /ORGANISM="Alexandrium catenella, Strain OF101" /LENGTH=362 /DNA_ID=CAMNT_0011645909 /DNA_START=1 /DNA_END=1088 /DNA_ORIENTATION=+
MAARARSRPTATSSWGPRPSFLSASSSSASVAGAPAAASCAGAAAGGKAAAAEEAAPTNVQVNGHDVPVVHLRQRKELLTAYVLWFCTGVFGGHLFYLERVAHGFLAVWSGNFFMLGWFLDLLLLPTYVRAANRCSVASSTSDGSFRGILCRLPPIIFLFISMLFGGYFFMPRTLHNLGVIDIDQAIAGTDGNPYDILGVPRDSSKDAATDAFLEKMKPLLTLPSCDGVCVTKKIQLAKAYEFMQGTPWRTEAKSTSSEGKQSGRDDLDRDSTEGRWADWADFLNAEWMEIKNAIGEHMPRQEGEAHSKRSRQRQRPRPKSGQKPPPTGRERPSRGSPSPATARKERKGKPRAGGPGGPSEL